VRSTRVIRPNKKAVDMRYLWYPSVIVGKGLSISRLLSYRLIVNDKEKCIALLSIRWEACSTSDHAVRRSAQRFYDEDREWCHPLMSHHSGFSWWMGKSLWSGAVLDHVLVILGHVTVGPCGSMHIRNSFEQCGSPNFNIFAKIFHLTTSSSDIRPR
jgi:hypothetical protein